MTRVELVQALLLRRPLRAAADRYYVCLGWVAVRQLIGTSRGRALDIGSGRGISAYALAKDGWQTTALEPDPSENVGAGAIRQLSAETGIRVSVVENWGEELPFESNSFDLVHCRQVLHHARDLPSLCKEAARVLKPNGTFIACTARATFCLVGRKVVVWTARADFIHSWAKSKGRVKLSSKSKSKDK